MYGSYSSASDIASLYGSSANMYSTPVSSTGWVVPTLVISFIIAVVTYFVFLSKKNEGRFIGLAGWLYDFLHFKKLAVEGILKILYITFTITITVMAFVSLSASFGAFVAILIGGNLLLRIGYELMLVLLIVCKNTSEINKKMSGQQ